MTVKEIREKARRDDYILNLFSTKSPYILRMLYHSIAANEPILNEILGFTMARAYYLSGQYDKTTYYKLKKIRDDIEDLKEYLVTAIKSKEEAQQQKINKQLKKGFDKITKGD